MTHCLSKEVMDHVNERRINLALIAYARRRPCIWNNDVEYGTNERDEAWKPIAEGFSLPVDELKKRWEGLRQMYSQLLKESISKGANSKWPYYSKLDEFLRAPTIRSWRKEVVMPMETPNDQRDDVEYIHLSSDSDGDPKENDGTPGSVQWDTSTEKAVETRPSTVVKLKTAEDVKNELRKIPPVSSTGGLSQREPSSSAKRRQSQPVADSPRARLGPKKRNSLPDIPDAKKRLIENCGELIALKKLDPNDTTRSLPSSKPSTISLPPPKMFGAAPTKYVAANHKPSVSQTRKSILNEIKRKYDIGERRRPKKKVPRLRALSDSMSSGNGVSTVSSDSVEQAFRAEASKVPPCGAITTASPLAESPKVTVHLTPSHERVTLHSVQVISENQLPLQDAQREAQAKERKKHKKKEKERTEKHGKTEKTKKSNDANTELILLDVSDTETPAEPKAPSKVCGNQNDLDNDKHDKRKTGQNVWGNWEDELKELRLTKDFHSKDEDDDVAVADLESTREMRKDFLLSFMPDMAEMTMEQRRFFKSKLMYLACNIDQFH